MSSDRNRIRPYLSDTTYKRFKKYCKTNQKTESAVVEAALQDYLDQTSDVTLFYRRLDRHQRALDRMHRDLEILSEAFGVYTQAWFTHTPKMSDAEKSSAYHQGKSRYVQFVERVAKQYTGGHRFIDDLPKDAPKHEPLEDLDNIPGFHHEH